MNRVISFCRLLVVAAVLVLIPAAQAQEPALSKAQARSELAGALDVRLVSAVKAWRAGTTTDADCVKGIKQNQHYW